MGMNGGMIGRILGLSGAVGKIGAAVTGVSEVFVPNATKGMTLDNRAYTAALGQYGQEFQGVSVGAFDRFMNGVNRVPRPALALGTIGLFVYAMAAPQSFSLRMEGLAYVPQPLWWLLGAVVSFYFGAREMSYARGQGLAGSAPRTGMAMRPIAAPHHAPISRANPALAEWKASSGR